MAVYDMVSLYFKLYIFFLVANFRLNTVLIEEKCHYLTAVILALIVLGYDSLLVESLGSDVARCGLASDSVIS